MTASGRQLVTEVSPASDTVLAEVYVDGGFSGCARVPEEYQEVSLTRPQVPIIFLTVQLFPCGTAWQTELELTGAFRN